MAKLVCVAVIAKRHRRDLVECSGVVCAIRWDQHGAVVFEFKIAVEKAAPLFDQIGLAMHVQHTQTFTCAKPQRGPVTLGRDERRLAPFEGFLDGADIPVLGNRQNSLAQFCQSIGLSRVVVPKVLHEVGHQALPRLRHNHDIASMRLVDERLLACMKFFKRVGCGEHWLNLTPLDVADQVIKDLWWVHG